MPTEAWYHQIHRRLLADDPTASAELVETVLDALVEELGKKYPRLRGSEMVADAVIDTLMSYIKRPVQFDPTRRKLFRYLIMSADGDLRNALAKLRRRKEISLEDVEVDEAGGKETVEAVKPEAQLDAKRMQQEIDKLFDKPKDRDIARLILDGERSTEAFVEILELRDLSTDGKRREVKRHKDRIKKRLKRYGERIRERKR